MTSVGFAVLALLFGYLIGGVPTADWIASAQGHDLRTAGSGNPGANNAREVGGWRLGVTVLLVEVFKGLAVVAMASMVGEVPAITGGIGAVLGNVLNPYRHFRGGQGLGIAAGVLAGAWPVVLMPVLITIGGFAIPSRSAPRGALIAIGGLVAAGLVWPRIPLPTAWGVPANLTLPMALGLAAVLAPKQIQNAMRESEERTSAAA